MTKTSDTALLLLDFQIGIGQNGVCNRITHGFDVAESLVRKDNADIGTSGFIQN